MFENIARTLESGAQLHIHYSKERKLYIAYLQSENLATPPKEGRSKKLTGTLFAIDYALDVNTTEDKLKMEMLMN